MNKEYKEKWIKALRSGEYQQAQSCLAKDDKTMCCLGVLGDLAVNDGKARWIIDEDGDYLWRRKHSPRSDFEILPKHAAEELFGINMVEQNRLARMNDHGKSFSVIADYIEKEL
jgi:hypothetical protein